MKIKSYLDLFDKTELENALIYYEKFSNFVTMAHSIVTSETTLEWDGKPDRDRFKHVITDGDYEGYVDYGDITDIIESYLNGDVPEEESE